MGQNKNTSQLQKKQHTARRVEVVNNTPKNPTQGVTKKTNQANQNTPLVRNPQRKNTASEQRPPQVAPKKKKNRNPGKNERNRNKKWREAQKPASEKKQTKT
jgi:hypothetical protein